MSLEVGRIIRGSETPSTFNFNNLKHKGKRPHHGYRLITFSLSVSQTTLPRPLTNRGTRFATAGTRIIINKAPTPA